MHKTYQVGRHRAFLIVTVLLCKFTLKERLKQDVP